MKNVSTTSGRSCETEVVCLPTCSEFELLLQLLYFNFLPVTPFGLLSINFLLVTVIRSLHFFSLFQFSIN